MITINLLPDELRVVEKRASGNQYGRIVLLFLGIFVLVTLFLFVDYFITAAKLGSADREWSDKRPEYLSLKKLRDEIDGSLKKEKDFMERFVTTHQPLTNILEWSSLYLPDYSWLTEVSMARTEGVGKLDVRGLAFSSKDVSSIEQIESYLQNLKSKMPDATLSLTTTRVDYAGVPLTQFNATYKWEDREVYDEVSQ